MKKVLAILIAVISNLLAPHVSAQNPITATTLTGYDFRQLESSIQLGRGNYPFNIGIRYKYKLSDTTWYNEGSFTVFQPGIYYTNACIKDSSEVIAQWIVSDIQDSIYTSNVMSTQMPKAVRNLSDSYGNNIAFKLIEKQNCIRDSGKICSTRSIGDQAKLQSLTFREYSQIPSLNSIIITKNRLPYAKLKKVGPGAISGTLIYVMDVDSSMAISYGDTLSTFVVVNQNYLNTQWGISLAIDNIQAVQPIIGWNNLNSCAPIAEIETSCYDVVVPAPIVKFSAPNAAVIGDSLPITVNTSQSIWVVVRDSQIWVPIGEKKFNVWAGDCSYPQNFQVQWNNFTYDGDTVLKVNIINPFEVIFMPGTTNCKMSFNLNPLAFGRGFTGKYLLYEQGSSRAIDSLQTGGMFQLQKLGLKPSTYYYLIGKYSRAGGSFEDGCIDLSFETSPCGGVSINGTKPVVGNNDSTDLIIEYPKFMVNSIVTINAKVVLLVGGVEMLDNQLPNTTMMVRVARTATVKVIWPCGQAIYGTTAIAETGLEKIKVFPNPTNDVLNLTFEGENFTVQVSDLLGRTVLEGKNEKVLNVSALPTGQYLLRILDQKGKLVAREKFVKVN